MVSVGGDIGFWDEPASGRWEADGDVHLKLWVISAEVAGLVNNQYIARCSDVSGFGVQGRYRLADGNIDGGFFGFSNCSDQLKPYKAMPVTKHSGGFVGSSGDRHGQPGASASARGGGTIKLPGGTDGEELLISSATGTPVVSLTGPGHQTYTTPSAPGQISTSGGRFISAIAPYKHQVMVFLRHPSGGTWNIQPTAASASIVKVAGAQDVPPASIRTQIRHRRGSRWALTYRISHYVAGTQVQFVERGRDSTHVIGTARNAGGVIAFVPQDAIGRNRRIFAYLRTSRGAPLRTILAGHYTAPAAARPGPVPYARMTRRRATALLTWGRAAGARLYRITIRGSDGRVVTLFTTPRRRSVVLQEVLPAEHFTARVVPEGGPNLLPGRSASARLGPAAAATVELISCTRHPCTAKLGPGALVLSAGEIHATLKRGGLLYAQGIAGSVAHPAQLALAPRRRLTRGRYTLILSYCRGGRTRTVRQTITIS